MLPCLHKTRIPTNYLQIMATLFLLSGLPGTGKTTLAKQLEQASSTVRLTPDEWLYPLLKDVTDKAELDRLRVPTEAVQWELAKKLLSLGINVILDWGFWSREQRAVYRREAEAIGAQVEFRFFEVNRDELINRLTVRNIAAAPGTFNVTEAELDRWIPWYEPPHGDELSFCQV